MPNYRTKMSYGAKYYLSPEKLMYARSYAFMYPQWVRELSAVRGLHAINMSGMPSAHNVNSSVEADALTAIELQHKIDLINDCARLADPCMSQWILLAVTRKGTTFDYLYGKGIPCDRSTFYDRRRRFYYLLSQKI